MSTTWSSAPTGVYVIDSKRYRGHLRYTRGHLWHGGRTLDRTLETLWWEATQVAETLGFGPDLHIYPVLCVHLARLSWLHELLVDGVPVLGGAALRPAYRSPARHSHPSRSPWSPAMSVPGSDPSPDSEPLRGWTTSVIRHSFRLVLKLAAPRRTAVLRRFGSSVERAAKLHPLWRALAWLYEWT
jgi:hypothetical protein